MWGQGSLELCGVPRMRTAKLTSPSLFFLWTSKNLIKLAESGLICAGLMGFSYCMWLKILSESICQSQLIVWPLTNIRQTVGKYVSEHWAVLNYTPAPVWSTPWRCGSCQPGSWVCCWKRAWRSSLCIFMQIRFRGSHCLSQATCLGNNCQQMIIHFKVVFSLIFKGNFAYLICWNNFS